jgi:nitrogen fixation NifU-like protein
MTEPAEMTDGCGPTVACGSMLTRMVQGRNPAEAAAIEAAELILALDGLPPEHIHCATLAVNTLHQAIANCCPEPGHPWPRLSLNRRKNKIEKDRT